GLRIWYISRLGKLRTTLLAVKEFMPDPQVLQEEALSELVKLWVVHVFMQFGIDPAKHVFAATTDAGSDMRCCCSKLLESFWEWCLPHLINCACVKAFGSSLDPAKGRE
ncbi:unnamed protein product, partial [Phaeothamnion confervicola]